ncbi:MAG: 3-isopropylmalate dehydratase large subunit, partial [Gammaproteobacteria bacterium]|nr:3-isopropylmalate dehydratase large subunit [Gammaproteobacteria bacterium]
KDIKSAQNAKLLRDFAQKHQIKNYFEVGRVGIEHALLPEKGIVVPGDLVIGADSHTCTYGAMGIFSTGVGSTDLAACYATGKVWLKVPETIKFVLKGKLNKWVSGKDLILRIIGDIGVDGATYKAMEFTGPVIKNLSMDDRLAMCNMAIEAGAKNGIIEPDDCTEHYVKDRAQRKYKTYTSDADCKYSNTFEYDVS